MWSSVPPGAVSSAAAETIELAAHAGLHLFDWQQWYLHGAMAQRADGLWVSLENYDEVPRQNGKGAVKEARQLAGLFLLNEELQIHTAHEFKTAYEHFRRLVDLVDGCDDLRRRVKIIRTGAGDQAIELLNGNRIRFMARSRSSGRGFSGDTLYLDESQNLEWATVGAVMPTLSARPNPQVWYSGSAPGPNAEVAHSVRRRVMEGDEPRLFGAIWGNEEGADPTDLANVARANPSLGLLIDIEFAEAEQRAMSPREHARERLGIAEEPEQSKADVMISLEAWGQCGERPDTWDQAKVAEGQPVVLAVSAPTDRSTASLVMAGYRADGLVHVEEMGFDGNGDPFTGVSWLKEALPRIVKAWGNDLVTIAIDPKDPAASVVAEVEAALGQKLQRVTLERFGAACVDFVDMVHECRIRHRGEFVFSDAVAGLRTRRIGDGSLWLWDRQTSKTNPAPIVAATLAVYAFPAAVAAQPKPVVSFAY